VQQTDASVVLERLHYRKLPCEAIQHYGQPRRGNGNLSELNHKLYAAFLFTRLFVTQSCSFLRPRLCSTRRLKTVRRS